MSFSCCLCTPCLVYEYLSSQRKLRSSLLTYGSSFSCNYRQIHIAAAYVLHPHETLHMAFYSTRPAFHYSHILCFTFHITSHCTFLILPCISCFTSHLSSHIAGHILVHILHLTVYITYSSHLITVYIAYDTSHTS